MANPKQKVVVKKVAAFPFPIQLKLDEKLIRGEVVKLESIGIMVKVEEFLVVNKPVEFIFEFPVLNATVRGLGKIVKTYDSLAGVKQKIHHLGEIHFTELSSEARDTINEFIKRLKKVKS